MATDAGRKPAVIFYIGDYDPAGVLIDVSLEREFRAHVDKRVSLQLERIAITPEQIEFLDLPTKPRKEGDKRAQHVEFTVEDEAIPANILREQLRVSIESLVPQGALDAAKVAEQSEREHLEWMARVCGTRP